MKKIFIFALWSAIALTSAAGFSSCSTSEDVAEDNPGYNKETEEVPVKFVFNVSTGNTASTRMTSADVQATSSDNFRGMDATTLMSFKLNNPGGHIYNSATSADKVYGLGPIFGTNSIGPDSKTNSNRVLQLAIPVGTDAFMFWGKALKNGTDDAQGKLEFNVDKTLSNTSFKLCKRVPEGTDTEKYNTTTLENYQQIITTFLNDIVQTKLDNQDVTFNGVTKKVTIAWKDYVKISGEGANMVMYSIPCTISGASFNYEPSDKDNTTKTICALGEILSSTFVKLNTIKGSGTLVELRGGSGNAVLRMLSDLFVVINKIGDTSQTTPTNMDETIAQALAQKITQNLLKVLNSSGTVFNTISSVKSNYSLSVSIPSGNDDLTKFPSVFGLPEGATLLLYNIDTNSYSYRTEVPTYNMGGGETFKIKNYMFPPELCYFGNSPIRTTNETVAENEFADGTTKWDDFSDVKWTSKNWVDNSTVSSSTRSVAMANNINYGTALLKTTVRYGVAALEDNNNKIQKEIDPSSNEPNLSIATNETSPFALTGILIGGQSPEVGWNYLTKGDDAFSAMIYDRISDTSQQAIPKYSANSSNQSNPTYTLVWDNWDQTKKDADQHEIYIALEFVNNSGKDFWGELNLIPKGGVFYISGKLNPNTNSSDRSAGITWPGTDTGESGSPYALPPYADNGTTIKQRRVFIQDYMTEAQFVLGKESLQHAMTSVPDLRSTQISLGLSVDLYWSTGMKFENVVLGGGTINGTSTNP